MAVTTPKLDIGTIRKDFPILQTTVKGKPLIYLDNAATAQKPQAVLDILDRYWTETNANIHRGVHHLSQKATAEYDRARDIIRDFVNAKSSKEIILTKGCTEAINLVATCLSRAVGTAGSAGVSPAPLPSPLTLKPGDEILLSHMEHHSNIVPWQIAAEVTGASIKVIPVTDEGEIDLDAYEKLLTEKVKLVGVVHVSNAIGTINPIKQMAKMAHDIGALVLVDGAQGGPHLKVDVQDLDADFYTLSCHKIYAPTGVGVLYGKQHLLEQLPPYHGGGDMIRSVSFQGTTYADLPMKFEAGTPNVAGVIGLGAAMEYVQGLDRQVISAYEDELCRYAMDAVATVPGVRLIGTAKEKASIVSFVMDGAHPHDIGTILDSEGIAIRAGHHCTQPLMTRFGVPATARASFSFYNTFEEADALVQALHKVREVFA